MSHRYLAVLIIFLPIFGHAQSNSDSLLKAVITNECDGKDFLKTEVLPSLTISTNDFADSLLHYIKREEGIPVAGKVTAFFFLTKKSQIFDLGILQGNVFKTNVLHAAIRHFAYLWKPAIKNGYEVCARAKLELEFSNGKLNIAIKQ